jgi:membrane protease YdiL (CAAX protease family)
MRKNYVHPKPLKSLGQFLLIVFLFTWSFWIPTALTGLDVNSSLAVLPYFIGAFGPSLAGIILISLKSSKETRGDFWKRLIDFKRISVKWYLIILLIFPAVFTGSILVSHLLGNPWPELSRMNQVINQPAMLILIVVTGLLTGPLAEELGWRGYALERLQNRFSPIISSLLLAPIWWVWHLPLFFIRGTTQAKWGIGTLNFWLFAAGILPLTLILTWVYNHTQRSILAAVLTHFMYNFSLGMVYPLSQTSNVLQVLLLSLAAAILMATTSKAAQ